MLVTQLAAFIGTFLLSFLMTCRIRNLSLARHWVSPPPSPRHLHNVPTPRMGGIAIFVSFLVVLALVLAADRFFHLELFIPLQTLSAILLPACLIFLLGLYDDLRSLSPYVKFAVQVLAAVWLFAGGLRVVTLPLIFGSETLAWFVALPLTVFWVLLITNAFNLIDGLDGLAAGSALFATVTMFLIASFPLSPNSLVAILAIVLTGSILGFLRFNFHPASIFLGDCGSLFIGFLLSALAIAGNQKSATAFTVAIPVVSFMLPILDTAVSVVRRFVGGQPLFEADREHIHHKLLQRGFSQRQAVGLLYGVSAVFGMLSVLLVNFGGQAIGLVLLAVGAVVWLTVQHLGYHEFVELRRVARRTVEQKQVMVNNLSIRRATERLAAVHTWPALRQVLSDAFESNDFDGYSLAVPVDKLPEGLDGDAGFRRENGKLLLSWSKGTEHGQSLPLWRLTIDLIASGERLCGWFRVHRYYSQRPLLFDINLLTSDFPNALAGAVERTLQAPQIPHPRPTAGAHRPSAGTQQPGAL